MNSASHLQLDVFNAATYNSRGYKREERQRLGAGGHAWSLCDAGMTAAVTWDLPLPGLCSLVTSRAARDTTDVPHSKQILL